MSKTMVGGVALAVIGIALIVLPSCRSEEYDASVTAAVAFYLAGALALAVAAAREPVSWGGRVLGVVLVLVIMAGAGLVFGTIGTLRCWTF